MEQPEHDAGGRFARAYDANQDRFGTKRARAYATDVRSWWKLTYERSGGIRVLTPSGH
jgi:hypothetical protein